MSRRSLSFPARVAASTAFLTAGAASAGVATQPPAAPVSPTAAVAAVSAEPAAASYAVKALVKRRLAVPAPSGTDAIRVSILGDGSGATVRIRLLSPTSSAVGGVEAYFASAPVVLDYKGWKTVNLPLSTFTFESEQNPETNSSTSSDTLFSLLPTINTIQIAVTASPTAKVFVDDLVWATAVSGPTDPPLGIIDNFETVATPAVWSVTGDFEQLRAAQAANNRVAAFVKSGQGSFQFVVRPASLDEKQLYAPALSARLKKQTTQPYALYIRPPFQSIRPESAPSPQELAALLRLEMTACAGETEPVTFSVFSAVDLKNATIKAVGPFRSESGQSELPLTAINLHVIRLGDGKPRTDPTAPVAELLMKDDQESLEGDLPAVRLTGDPLTTIPAGTSKQFWVTVTVPKNQVNSIYSGKIVFSAPGVKPTTLPIRINVLPVQLRTAFLQYGVDLRSRLSAEGAAAGDRVVTPEIYAAELANVRDHGFKIVTISEPVSGLGQALSLYKQAGIALNGPVVINTPLRTQSEIGQVEALRAGAGLTPAFEIYYKMPSEFTKDTPPAAFGDYVKGLRKASNNKGLVVAPVASRAVYDSLSPSLGSGVFAPVFAASSDYTSTLVATGKREIGSHDYWSWNMALQNPLRNRLLAGYLLCRTGSNSSPLYGAIADPYTNSASASGVLYPVQGGVVDTIQWEAVREGIDDVRYFGVLKNYIRDLKDRQLRKDLTNASDAYIATVLKKPLWTLSPGDYQKTRQGMINQALKLLTVIRASVPTYPG